ncbi:hypothetical protein FB567DRAFT_605464 [Paraphoma chrysanthemicola]|uniref:Uncharacterized protein n=1 Tax=Paraphoma chrysanthemicola TaxID=798071 RepID=A0A8K0R371_9PLEO|nr:hypothetical protein FB567DRAFT_605464 [Paraphoma chrysanthemicola]
MLAWLWLERSVPGSSVPFVCASAAISIPAVTEHAASKGQRERDLFKKLFAFPTKRYLVPVDALVTESASEYRICRTQQPRRPLPGLRQLGRGGKGGGDVLLQRREQHKEIPQFILKNRVSGVPGMGDEGAKPGTHCQRRPRRSPPPAGAHHVKKHRESDTTSSSVPRRLQVQQKSSPGELEHGHYLPRPMPSRRRCDNDRQSRRERQANNERPHTLRPLRCPTPKLPASLLRYCGGRMSTAQLRQTWRAPLTGEEPEIGASTTHRTPPARELTKHHMHPRRRAWLGRGYADDITSCQARRQIRVHKERRVMELWNKEMAKRMAERCATV